MARTKLKTTIEGLLALRKAHAGVALQGPDGFISSEIMYRDAAAAHELEAILMKLFLAAAKVHQECRLHHGKPDKEALSSLEAALAAANGWNWEMGQGHHIRLGGPRARARALPHGSSKESRAEVLAIAGERDRPAA